MSVNGEYCFAVGKGNYPNQIVRQLESRGCWKQISEDEAIQQADFYWRPINFESKGYTALNARLKAKPDQFFVFNHFEKLNGICTKTNLIHSLRNYYEQHEEAKQQNYSVFESTPTTFVVQEESSSEMMQFQQRFREL